MKEFKIICAVVMIYLDFYRYLAGGEMRHGT